jgi:hypothetical protein
MLLLRVGRCSQRRFSTVRSKVDFGDGIILRKVSSEGDPKPIALVCGWMAATQRQMKTYLAWYHKHGIDTLSYSVGPKHVLNPKSASSHMQKVLDTTVSQNPKDIILHHFSVGGFLCGQALRIMASDREKYGHLIDEKIKVQIYDSPPDIRGIPVGLASHVFPEPKGMQVFLHASIRKTLDAYLTITENTAGVEYRASSEAFHNNILPAPSLWFYSLSDNVANHRDCETVVGKWKQRGIEVEECVWDTTAHIQHGRQDPERYFGTLYNFLNKHGITGVEER